MAVGLAGDCYSPAVPIVEWARRPLVWCFVLGALAAGGYLVAELYLLDGDVGFPLDDSWIHLTFARNLAAGEGLSYQDGRLVTGSTAPLWTAFLSLAFLLPGSPLPWAKALGVACYLLLLPATYRLGRELGLSRGFAASATAMTALTSWLLWSALSGMEIPLFSLLSVFGTTLHLRERRRAGALPVSALVLALAALARPEGLLLLALAGADRLVGLLRSPAAERTDRVRAFGAWLLAAAIVLLPTLLFYRVVGDTWVPTTFSAKTAGWQRWLPSTRYLEVVVEILILPQPVTTLLALAGALLLLRRGVRRADRSGLPALWLLGLPLAYSLISPVGPGIVVGNFGRYFFPLFPMVAVVGLVAIEHLLGESGRRALATRPGLGLAAAILVCLPTAVDWIAGVERYTRCVLNVEDGDVAMARWLEGRLPEEAVLAVNDIGAIGYLLPNPLLDLAGIANPEIRDYFDAAEAAGEHWRAGIRRFLEERRPDYLVIFPEWFPELTGGERYRELRRIEIRGNMALGSDVLALYSTPWTAHPLDR